MKGVDSFGNPSVCVGSVQDVRVMKTIASHAAHLALARTKLGSPWAPFCSRISEWIGAPRGAA